jgi:hypothetical protein
MCKPNKLALITHTHTQARTHAHNSSIEDTGLRMAAVDEAGLSLDLAMSEASLDAKQRAAFTEVESCFCYAVNHRCGV